jgi:hypothetical protein
MDSEQLLVWLEVMPDATAQRRVGLVCRQHADAMVVPRGWTLDDRREARPRLFRVADTTAARRSPRRTGGHRRHDADAAEAQLSFDATTADDIVTDVPAEDETAELTVGEIRPLGDLDPDETQAMPWRPVFDDNDDLGGLLKATSPLLSRAFRGQPKR